MEEIFNCYMILSLRLPKSRTAALDNSRPVGTPFRAPYTKLFSRGSKNYFSATQCRSRPSPDLRVDQCQLNEGICNEWLHPISMRKNSVGTAVAQPCRHLPVKLKGGLYGTTTYS